MVKSEKEKERKKGISIETQTQLLDYSVHHSSLNARAYGCMCIDVCVCMYVCLSLLNLVDELIGGDADMNGVVLAPERAQTCPLRRTPIVGNHLEGRAPLLELHLEWMEEVESK